MSELVQASTGIEGVQIDYSKVLEHLKLNPRDPKAQALVLVCRQYGLDPVLKHAVLVDGNLYVTRDGLLHVAHRSGMFDGIEVLEQGETDSHFTAKVAVYRRDMGRPFSFIGRFPKLRDVNEWRDGSGGKRVKMKVGEEPHPYGPEMAVKCAVSMALRHAFDVSMSAIEERWDVEPPADMTVTRLHQESGAAGQRGGWSGAEGVPGETTGDSAVTPAASDGGRNGSRSDAHSPPAPAAEPSEPAPPRGSADPGDHPTQGEVDTPAPGDRAIDTGSIDSDTAMQDALKALGFDAPEAWKQAATLISADPAFVELKGSQISARARLMSYRGERAQEALNVLRARAQQPSLTEVAS